MSRRNPISEDRFREITDTLAAINTFLGEQDRYEACGVDCTDRRNAASYIQSQLQTILDVWRDGKPPPKVVDMKPYG